MGSRDGLDRTGNRTSNIRSPSQYRSLYTKWAAAARKPKKNVKFSIVLFYSLFPTWYTAFLFTYNNCYLLSSTCFRPHRPIIRRSKLYMQPMVFSPSADVFVVWPLRLAKKNPHKRQSFLNCRTTKTSAEGENTIGCTYNLDLLMMGLWGLKHVEERR